MKLKLLALGLCCVIGLSSVVSAGQETMMKKQDTGETMMKKTTAKKTTAVRKKKTTRKRTAKRKTTRKTAVKPSA